MTTFANRLKELRTEKGISQLSLSKEVHIALRSLQRYEYGEREANVSQLIALADYFDVSLDYLVGISDNPKRN